MITGRRALITDTSALHLKEAARELGTYVPFVMAPTAWQFAADPPEGSIVPSHRKWSCMFAMMKRVQAGEALSFSSGATGCPGASSYLGFREMPLLGAATYLSVLEKFKKDLETAMAFYQNVQPAPAREKQLVFQLLEEVPGPAEVEVVNLWVSAASLSQLLTLANFDRRDNNSVIIPFASGCQSVWTIPYKEKNAMEPRAVVGSLDPTVRRFLPPETLSFSLPANRFLELCSNIPGSFLDP
jgi:uncharacterized protein (DUF169 family)